MTSTYPFVVDVALSDRRAQPGPPVSVLSPSPSPSPSTATWTVGPAAGLVRSGHAADRLHRPPVDGGWQDARTWVGTFNITPITGDGYQLIRVAGARAADDPWLVTGDDAGRFRFEIITSGTEAMNLQATGGEGTST